MSSSAISSAITTNISQNQDDFTLLPIEEQSIIFKKQLFSKTLDPPKAEPERLENFRTVTVRCLYPGCR
jgi:hypothetical protein